MGGPVWRESTSATCDCPREEQSLLRFKIAGGLTVEGDGRADVDEGKGDGDQGCEHYSTNGNVALSVDVRQEVGEGEALVATEGPDVACHGGEVSHVAADDEEEDLARKAC